MLKFIEDLVNNEEYHGQIIHVKVLPEKKPIYGTMPEKLHSSIVCMLKEQGIEKLYSHQCSFINEAIKSKNCIVVTPTSSGKTLCYNLPVLNSIIANEETRALYIFPTKSLSQDQDKTIQGLKMGINSAVYDGDTSSGERATIRETGQILITNPDMLHKGILPNHLKWHKFFKNLKYIIIDEIHTYRGVIGSHMAHIIRRLRRLCKHYMSDPIFLTCSATIANPKEHAEQLVGLPFTLINDNGAPSGNKYFILWKPPNKKPYIYDVSWLLLRLIKEKRSTLVFTRSRHNTERMLRYVKRCLEKTNGGNALASKVMSYRGGYLAAERRYIEGEIFNGRILGVIATNALELGIDIGYLDCCIIVGFPGTIASTWQQAGRAGRQLRDSLVVYMGIETPLDQYFINNKEAIFSNGSENALISVENPYIMYGHARCACHELPMDENAMGLWPPVFKNLLSLLEEDGEVIASGDNYYYVGSGYPADKINIRVASSNTYLLLDKSSGNRTVTVMDQSRVFSEAYVGAVYLHLGESFVVDELNIPEKKAFLNRQEVDYYTMVKRQKDTEIREIAQEKFISNSKLSFGYLKITTKVTSYIKKHELTGQVLGTHALDLPEEVMETQGFWFTINREIEDIMKHLDYDLMGSLHAVEHAAIGLLPLISMCDRNDIGGLSIGIHPQTMAPTIFIHDEYEGGIGFSERAYHNVDELLSKTLQVVSKCDCEDGCPSCIYSPKCSNFNRPLHKEGSVYLLKYLMGQVSK